MKGVWVCKDSSRINHLFFLDDVLLFIRNSKTDAEHVRTILQDFESMSGQKINLDKSILCFSPNTPMNQSN